MKFYTGEKTIIHDGTPYGPDGQLDLEEAEGRKKGLTPVNDHAGLPMRKARRKKNQEE